MKRLKAFSLVEVIVMVTLLALSIGLVLSWTLTALKKSELIAAGESLGGLLRQQYSAAYYGKDNLSQGVQLNGSNYILFAGDDFLSSSVDSRQSFSLPADITAAQTLTGSGNEVVFARSTGEVASDGSITLSHTDIPDTFVISISPLGLVSW